MGVSVVRRTLLVLATIAQLGVAIAMIVFIRRLSDVGMNTETQKVEEMSCSLNAGTKSDPTGVAGNLEDESLCVLAYGGAAITLLAMFVLSILLVCFPLRCVGSVAETEQSSSALRQLRAHSIHASVGQHHALTITIC